jgi:hypothetical protein
VSRQLTSQALKTITYNTRYTGKRWVTTATFPDGREIEGTHKDDALQSMAECRVTVYIAIIEPELEKP